MHTSGDDSPAPSTALLPADWAIPDAFRTRLGSRVGPQRHMIADGHLLLVLHAPPLPDEDSRRGHLFLRSPDGRWQANPAGTVAELLGDYAGRLLSLDALEEKATSALDYLQVLEHITPLHRALRHLHEVLQAARSDCPRASELIDLRDEAYRLERTAELLLEDIRNALDVAQTRQTELQARESSRMAASAHHLNLLAAFFFPTVTLMAIFGSNLRNGLESAPPPWPLLGILGIGLATGAILTLLLTRNRADH
ncbi:MAG: hypothetical protein H6993_13465 [Pseudomonadales bacterium]|nr:hypothetical protein [Pseudomonadales bacterium]MCP5184969.1 hypothetical protein [Pseudomonadales bacterium]